MEQPVNEYQVYHGSHNGLLWMCLIVILILVGVVGWLLMGDSAPVSDSTESLSQDTPLVSDFEYEYYQVDVYYPHNGDQSKKIIRVNQETGEEDVIIPDLTNKLPILKENPNFAFREFAQPADSSLVIFYLVVSGSDSPTKQFYALDLVSKEFTRMNINETIADVVEALFLSPDQTKLVWIPNHADMADGYQDRLDQEMHIIDLVNDSHRVAVSLEGNETFTMGLLNELFGHYYGADINWVNNETIKYAVFDHDKVKENRDERGVPLYPREELLNRVLMEYREYSL